jgi:outer membrane protein assembly factor BamE (lipoprotein component of BamABCDE complex)
MGRQDGRVWSATGQRVRSAVLVLGLATLAACAPVYSFHGYIPPEEELALVQVGVDTRESLIAVIGRPTLEGVMTDTGYYYIQSQFRDFAFQESQEINRQILRISFDPNGVVTNIERFGLEDGMVVALSRRVTDDGLTDTTFLRQLFANVGNFDGAQLISLEDE